MTSYILLLLVFNRPSFREFHQVGRARVQLTFTGQELNELLFSFADENEDCNQDFKLCRWIFMVAYVIGQIIIFLPCDFFLLSSFFFFLA